MTDQALTAFSEHMRTMARGSIDAEITDELAALVREVRIHNRAGTLTIVLGVKPDGGEGDWVALDVKKISANAPQPARRGAVFYARSNGDLLRDDPEQMKLQLRKVGESVDPTTGEIVNG